ncbi:hypothetical protein ACFPYJ_26880 [Paenibacillus solisilvae]|uniref:Uncharacterized protein n=1 Tax=Paenibacillus solisilvae TaxID=2486751 RepID=A0ABW0W3C2_9BACL
MTIIGLLTVVLLSSLLLAVLDMYVFHETLQQAFSKQGFGYNSWQTYLILAAAFAIPIIRRYRIIRRHRNRRNHGS